MLPAANTFRSINSTISDYLDVDEKGNFQNIDISYIINHTRSELFNGNKEVILKTKIINTKINERFNKLYKRLRQRIYYSSL